MIVFPFFRLYHGDTTWAAEPQSPISAQGRVALTFNDGPDPAVTPKILEILTQAGVTADFFVVGRQAAGNPDLILQMAKAGVSLQNHSYLHGDWSRMSQDQMTREIRLTDDIIEEITGKRPDFFRPPRGIYSPEIFAAARDTSHVIVFWSNIMGDDRRVSEITEFYERVEKVLYNGSILMLHGDHAQVIDILPGLIQLIRQRGFDIVPLHELYHVG